MKKLILIIALFLSIKSLFASNKNRWQELFYNSYYFSYNKMPPLRQHWFKLSVSKHLIDLEQLSYGLDAILAMFEVTDSTTYLNDAITITNNIITWAQVSKDIAHSSSPFKDYFKGWVENDKGTDTSMFNQEVVLYEIYYFQYVCRLLKDIRNNTRFKLSEYKHFYYNTLHFVEENIWKKWEIRGLIFFKNRYHYMLLPRTHMACHWAYISAELSFLTTSQNQRKEYLNFVTLYNKELENNFHKFGIYITWNSTWDSDLKTKKFSIIQDVSHANLIVSYIVEAYSLGVWNDYDVINRLINTLKDRLWDPTNCSFKDNIDGSTFQTSNHSSVGNFQADGFVKLSRFDPQLIKMYEKYISCSNYITAWFQYGQLFANLALSQKIFNTGK